MTAALTALAIAYGLLCVSGFVHVVRVLLGEWRR